MDFSKFSVLNSVTLVASLPLLFGFWKNFSSIFSRMRRFFIIEIQICDQRSVYGLRRFLASEFKISVGENYLFKRTKCLNKKTGENETPLCRALPESGFMRKGLKFIYISDNYRLPEDWGWQPSPKISFFRWSFPERYFPDHANSYIDDLVENKKKMFKIEEVRGTRLNKQDSFSTTNNSKENKGEKAQNKNGDIVCLRESIIMDGTLDDYCLDSVQDSSVFQIPENCEVILDELKLWKRSEKWYSTKWSAECHDASARG